MDSAASIELATKHVTGKDRKKDSDEERRKAFELMGIPTDKKTDIDEKKM